MAHEMKKPESVSDDALDAARGGTMTRNDLDNGRLIAEIGVAPSKPAEFVIFRIGQKTADAHD